MPTCICGKINRGVFKECSKLRTLFFHYVTEVDDDAFDDKNMVETVVVMNDFKCSEKFWNLVEHAKIMCRQNSQFADLSYDGYQIVLTSK